MNNSSRASRIRRIKSMDCMYETVGRIGDPCVYCGVVSDTLDHVPPIAVAESWSEVDVDIGRLRKVPACSECNSALNASTILRLPARKAWIKERLKRKYKTFLRMPKWDEEELEELDERFADDIRRSSVFAEWIKARVSW